MDNRTRTVNKLLNLERKLISQIHNLINDVEQNDECLSDVYLDQCSAYMTRIINGDIEDIKEMKSEKGW